MDAAKLNEGTDDACIDVWRRGSGDDMGIADDLSSPNAIPRPLIETSLSRCIIVLLDLYDEIIGDAIEAGVAVATLF